MNSPIPRTASAGRPTSGERYRPRSYVADDAAVWFPALYGHVPGYQIDYLYRPRNLSLQSRRLRPVHMRHLTGLIRYLEAPAGAKAAFLIGNLSSNDQQHVSGRGGLVLACTQRVEGASDQAGRPRPVLTQCLMTVDRPVQGAPLAAALLQFFSRACEEGPRWYIAYSEAPTDAGLTAYLRGFDLVSAPDGTGSAAYHRCGPLPFRRLLITCPDLLLTPLVAVCAARLAAVLFHSDVRWTTISNSYQAEEDVGAELLVRFVPRRTRPSATPGTMTRALEELVDLGEDALADLLGLRRAGSATAAAPPGRPREDAGDTRVIEALPTAGGAAQPAPRVPIDEDRTVTLTPPALAAPRPGPWRWLLRVLLVLLVLGVFAFLYSVATQRGRTRSAETERRDAQTRAPAQAMPPPPPVPPQPPEPRAPPPPPLAAPALTPRSQTPPRSSVRHRGARTKVREGGTSKEVGLDSDLENGARECRQICENRCETNPRCRLYCDQIRRFCGQVPAQVKTCIHEHEMRCCRR